MRRLWCVVLAVVPRISSRNEIILFIQFLLPSRVAEKLTAQSLKLDTRRCNRFASGFDSAFD